MHRSGIPGMCWWFTTKGTPLQQPQPPWTHRTFPLYIFPRLLVLPIALFCSTQQYGKVRPIFLSIHRCARLIGAFATLNSMPDSTTCRIVQLVVMDVLATPLIHSVNFSCMLREHLVYNTLSTVQGVLMMSNRGMCCDVLHQQTMILGTHYDDSAKCAMMTR